MKITFAFLLAFFLFATINSYGQTKTIILIRHGEKDLSDPRNPDPQLSAEGKQRAENLVKAVKKYDPQMIFSSMFIRTKGTVRPLADKDSLQIHYYDQKNLDLMVKRIMESPAKKIIVVGHNTTTPALANLLIKQDKYKALDESTYNKMWVIKIKNNKIEEKVVEY